MVKHSEKGTNSKFGWTHQRRRGEWVPQKIAIGVGPRRGRFLTH